MRNGWEPAAHSSRQHRLISECFCSSGRALFRSSPLLRQIFATKSIDKLISDSELPENALRKHLGPVSLTALGIGAVIGSGIFTVIGVAIGGNPSALAKWSDSPVIDLIVGWMHHTSGAVAGRPGAGPALALSLILVAIVCALTGLCYAELASMIPIAVSAYTYTYATMGELIAWIIGWDLILEYAFSNMSVSVGFAAHIVDLLDWLGINLSPKWLSPAYLPLGLQNLAGQDIYKPGWHAGFDMVYAKRRSRAGESWLKRGTARGFYRLMQRMGDLKLPEDTGDFRLMSRRVVDAVRQLREQHRFMKGLFAWVGYPTTYVLYDRDPRCAGVSKWSYWKLWNLALEGITSFTVMPLKFATYAGLAVALLSMVYVAEVLVKTLIIGNPVAGYPSLMSVVLFLGGVQLMFLGVIGEYLGRVFNETKQRPLYLVARYVPSAVKVST